MDELYEVIAAIIERRRDEPRINAAWVANEACQTVDPARVSVTCIYNAALEQARMVLRRPCWAKAV
jgi:hypothetical protein